MKPSKHYKKGIKDASYIPTEGNTCVYFKRWKQMLRKCYAKSNKKNDLRVCKEWLIFSKFRNWMKSQEYEGKILSITVLDQYNTEFNPAKAVFIDKEVYNLIAPPTVHSGKLPQGVSLDKNRSKFKAVCSHKGKLVYLGSYDMPPEAHEAYCKYKSEILREAAADQTDLRVNQALIDRADSYFISFL